MKEKEFKKLQKNEERFQKYMQCKDYKASLAEKQEKKNQIDEYIKTYGDIFENPFTMSYFLYDYNEKTADADLEKCTSEATLNRLTSGLEVMDTLVNPERPADEPVKTLSESFMAMYKVYLGWQKTSYNLQAEICALDLMIHNL